MGRLIILLFMTVFLVSCSRLNEEDKTLLRVQLSRVRDFEEAYLLELGSVKNRKEFAALFKRSRADVLELVRSREGMGQKSKALKNFRVDIRRLPDDFKKDYLAILKYRRDISKMELDLMKKFKARELDTPDVYILGSSIKKSVFIDG